MSLWNNTSQAFSGLYGTEVTLEIGKEMKISRGSAGGRDDGITSSAGGDYGGAALRL